MHDNIREKINEIDDETKKLISEFAVLWNEYETEYLRGSRYPGYSNASRKIDRMRWNNELVEKVNAVYEKFKRRYYGANAEQIRNFFGISFCEVYNEFGRLVQHKDIDEDEYCKISRGESPNDRLKFLFLISKRVRNNMFHGIKDISGLNGQKELFAICNETMFLMLEDCSTASRNFNR